MTSPELDPNRTILGIWGYSSDMPEVAHHDSGAALIADGKVLAAINEERISRKKGEGRWPTASIDEVIRLANIGRREVDEIVLGGMAPFERGKAVAAEVIRHWRATGEFLANRLLYAALTAKKIQRRGPRGFIADVHQVPHHDAHAASAFYTAPFDEATIITLDGIGDSTWCGGVFVGRGGKLERLRLFSGYASVGILYSYVTKAFGFRPARHEGKITGLAGHGDSSRLIDRFREVLKYENGELTSRLVPKLFRAREDAQWGTGWIDELMEDYSREDIAAALQRHTEEIVAAIARDAVRETGIRDVAVAGGVFANVRVNQVVREAAGGQIWIHPNMGDGGISMGAALLRRGRRIEFPNVYLGTPVGALPSTAGAVKLKDPARFVARACNLGYIVGYAEGRMEYGPRALGHRTIFASATDATINDTLNKRLRRTEFMPFAPITTDRGAARFMKGWTREDIASRYMTITYAVTDACRTAAPAIVHVDGTARPQVVFPEHGTIYRIIEEYGKLTGNEILINTSFNIHEEPIVRTADDALRSYKEDAVDILVVEDSAVARPEILEKVGL